MNIRSVGVGKSEIARGYIRNALQDDELVVCSPTFLIEQQYLHPIEKYLIHHIDLYRLQPNDDIPVDLSDGINIIEWSENLGEKKIKFPNRLEVVMKVEKESETTAIANEEFDDEFDLVGHHVATLSWYGEHWKDRINLFVPLLEQLNFQKKYDPLFVQQIRQNLLAKE